MNIEEAAQKVLDKVLGMSIAPKQIAVFVSKDKSSINMTKPTTDIFNKAISVRLHDFAGVYDARATIEMIVDDLSYAGFRCDV